MNKFKLALLIKHALRFSATRLKILFFGVYNTRWYPSEIRESIKVIDSSIENLNLFSSKPNFLNKLVLSPKQSSSTGVKLAGKNFSYEDLLAIWDESKIEKNFDTEVLNASHRFHWMLEELVENQDSHQVKDFIDLFDKWHKLVKARKSKVPYQPYNISERICNLTTFLGIAQNNDLIAENLLYEFKDFINKQLIELKDSLEYPASNIINNHVLNNARALYIGGYFVQRNDFISLAKKMFTLHIPEMIGKSGYLLESSSHYQILLTRSLLEVTNIAILLEDKEFTDWIKSVTSSMYKASIRLSPSGLSDAGYPTIGDISPDIALNWFSLNKDNSTGWNKLWSFPQLNLEATNLFSERNDGWNILSKEGWHLVSFSHPIETNYPSGHGHEDFGSFVLYHQGTQIFTDIGRISYDQNLEYEYVGYESYAHSTLTFNREKLEKKRSNIILRFTALLAKRTRRSVISDKNSITWRSCKKGNFEWTRELKVINKNEIEILDSFQAVLARGSLYLAPEIKVLDQSKKSISIGTESNLKFVISFSGEEGLSINSVNCFPSYGTVKKTHRIDWKKESNNKRNLIKIIIKKV